MDLAGYIAAARRWWPLILLATLLGGVGGWLGSSAAPRTWEASSRLLVGPVNADFDTLRASEQLAQTYADLATSDAVLARALNALALPGTPADLREVVSVRSDATSRILTVRARSGEPANAARLADAVASALAGFAVSTTARPEGEVTIVDPGTTGADPVAPQVELVVLLAAFAAMLAALLVVGVIEVLDHRVRSLDELRRTTGRPVAGPVPSGSGGIVADVASGAEAAAYRSVVASLPLAGDPAPLVLVADADGGRAGGQVTANLAAALAGTGMRVRLVDARDGAPMDPRLLLGLRSLTPAAPRAATARSGSGVEIIRGTAAQVRELVGPDGAAVADDARDGRTVRGTITLVDIGDPREALDAREWVDLATALLVVVVVAHTDRRALREVLDRIDLLGAVHSTLVALRPQGLTAQIGASVSVGVARGLRSAGSPPAPPQR